MNFLPYYHNKDQDISASVSFENFRKLRIYVVCEHAHDFSYYNIK